MRLFSRLRTKKPVEPDTISELQERVREMRKRIRRDNVDLAELFALLREDERPIMRKVEAQKPGVPRVRPDQVPSPSAPPTPRT